jgi:monovalent cation:H+ antiporter-2, CPA2 family
MSSSLDIVRDYAVIMAVAAVITFVFHKLRQPLILGYLIAGIIIGPFTPPFSFVSRLDVLSSAADLGVILLLFGVGLEFPLYRLKRIGLKVYTTISLVEILLMFVISYGIGSLLHWSLMDSLFVGAALASSGTVIIAKVLQDMGKFKDMSALLMMGILVAEDLIVVLMLAIITSVVSVTSSTIPDLAWATGKILLFVFGTLIVGIFIIPKIIDWISRPEKNTPDEQPSF